MVAAVPSDLASPSPRAAASSPSSERTANQPETAPPIATLGLIAAVALVALNLRPAVVAVGPLAGDIRAGTGLSALALGLLTTLPVVCFGLFALAGPPLARRLGLERAVMAALALLVIGIALRLASPTFALFLGSALAGIGIALGNVLMPAVVKRHFAARTGPVMAVYVVALNGGAALAAGLTVPLRDALDVGWRTALGAWGLLALAAALLWLPATRTRTATPREDGERSSVWRSSLAWATAAFIGLQSMVFFALTAWVPTLLQDAGMSQARAGLMLSLLALCGIAGGLAAPVLAARLEDQRSLVTLIVGLLLTGLVGLIVAPAPLAVLWMVVLGVGLGAGIGLALTLFLLRTRTTAGATQLSAMAQAVGYGLAATGPLLAGALNDLTGGWTASLLFLIVVLVPLQWAGWSAAAARTLEDETTTALEGRPA